MYIVAVLEYIAADILKVIMFDINLIQNQLSVEYRYNDFFCGKCAKLFCCYCLSNNEP